MTGSPRAYVASGVAKSAGIDPVIAVALINAAVTCFLAMMRRPTATSLLSWLQDDASMERRERQINRRLRILCAKYAVPIEKRTAVIAALREMWHADDAINVMRGLVEEG